MNVREAVAEDNDELQELQAKCPQGTTLVVSTVNTPDFFARAKAYESYKVFVACEGQRNNGVKSTLDPCWIIHCINREIKPDMIKNRRIKKNIEAMQFELSKGQE